MHQPMTAAPPPVPPAQSSTPYGRIGALVETRIDTLIDAERERWSAVDEELVAPIEALRTLVRSGGKRLRPVFCQWGFVGVGGAPDDPALVDAAAGLELLHTFALLHDDVMDGSDTRRGLEAVHRRFMRVHDQAGWQGEARRFGEGVAILVGDLAFVYADQLMAGVPRETAAIFTELRVEVNVGQYLDLLGSVQGQPSIAAARRICVYKSGSTRSSVRSTSAPRWPAGSHRCRTRSRRTASRSARPSSSATTFWAHSASPR